jgi:hypothetical protein
LIGVRPLQEGAEGTRVEQIIENVVIGHGGYARSFAAAMNSSMSP